MASDAVKLLTAFTAAFTIVFGFIALWVELRQ